MDNDDKTVGQILTRRDAIRVASLSGLVLLFGRRAGAAEAQEKVADSVQLVVTPEVEEGPFFVDEGLNRKNLLEGTERKSVVGAAPLNLRFKVFGIRGKKAAALKGAHVDIWHCDAAGIYSDEPSGSIQDEDTRGQKWLRGYQVTDEKGFAEFDTIYPGWYTSRTIHIHVKVRYHDPSDNRSHEFTTQVYFDEADNDVILANPPYNDRGKRRVRNASDGLYASKQADGTMVGSHLHVKLVDEKDSTSKVGEFSIAMKLS